MKDKGFSTRLLDSLVEKRRKENEKRRKELLGRLFLALDRLSKKVHFGRVYVFGSLARPGRFRKLSDIDLGFLGLENKAVVKTAALLSREMGLNVDVLQLEGHRLADKIIREGIPWEKKK